jgi:hypothetical protein
MGRLPPPADQAWLLDELARLVATGGERQLVRAPIRRPIVTEFPDPWTTDLASLHRLCQRMMRYAGLGAVDFGLTPRPDAPFEVPLTFTGLDGGVAHFAASGRGLEEVGEVLIGSVAREVARAWIALHAVQATEGCEARLADLTAVYLGFGVFMVNAAGPGPGLPPEHRAFALAAQILARRMSCLATWRLLRLLEPTSQADARSALRHLRPAEQVRQRLGLAILDDPPAIDLLWADRPPVD